MMLKDLKPGDKIYATHGTCNASALECVVQKVKTNGKVTIINITSNSEEYWGTKMAVGYYRSSFASNEDFLFCTSSDSLTLGAEYFNGYYDLKELKNSVSKLKNFLKPLLNNN